MKRSLSETDLSPREDITRVPYHWVDQGNEIKSNYGFTAETKDALLSSSTVDAKYVLRFTLDFVFDWFLLPSLEPDEQINHNNRVILLEFVIEWLAVEEGGRSNRIPSLRTLCAQRIAMDIFRKFVPDINQNFEDRNMVYFAITIFYHITLELSKLSKYDAQAHVYPFVMEEVCIFVIVYLLYIDIRKLRHAPTIRKYLQLPTPGPNNDVFWWDSAGWRSVESVVKNPGWGSQAKLGLLPYSVFVY